jgi:hypothetical protein
MSLHPNTDLVAVAWLRSIPGIAPTQVATSLPQDNTTWAGSGFVTVATVGGTPAMYLPVKQPVVQVDCWAVNPSSGRAPWGKANHLAETVRAHIEDTTRTANIGRRLTFAVGDYAAAAVSSAWLRTEPRRGITLGSVPVGDEASYARFLFDLELWWREL